MAFLVWDQNQGTRNDKPSAKTRRYRNRSLSSGL
jgi:hypothetical protein